MARRSQAEQLETERQMLVGVDLKGLGLTEIQFRRVEKWRDGIDVSEIAQIEGADQSSVRNAIAAVISKYHRVKNGMPPKASSRG